MNFERQSSMRDRTWRWWMVITCFLLASSCILGQTLEQESGGRRFYVVGYGESFFTGIHYKTTGSDGESKNVLLEFMPDQRSLAYKTGDDVDQLEFFTESESDDGKVIQSIVGRVRLLNDTEDLLLVFLEGEGFRESGEYEILAFSETDSEWGARAFRILNLSGAELNVDFGKHAFQLGDGDSRIVGFNEEETVIQRLRISVYWNGSERDVLNASMLPDQRYGKLLVLKPPLTAGSLRLRLATIW